MGQHLVKLREQINKRIKTTKQQAFDVSLCSLNIQMVLTDSIKKQKQNTHTKATATTATIKQKQKQTNWILTLSSVETAM